MYVHRKPPLWPYLMGLFVLLTLCVFAPNYWHGTQVTLVAPPAPVWTENSQIPVFSRRSFHSHIGADFFFVPELLAAELNVHFPIDTRLPLYLEIAPSIPPRTPLRFSSYFSSPSPASGVLCFLADPVPTLLPPPVSDPVVIIEPESPTAATAAEPVTLDRAVPGIDAAAALRSLGRQVASVQPSHAVDSFVSKLVNRVGTLPAAPQAAPQTMPPVQAEPPVSSQPALSGPVLLTNPNERLAMAPQRIPSQPKLELPSTPAKNPWVFQPSPTQRPWAAPHALVTRLERLQRHPVTNPWATEVLAELQHLSDLEPSSRDAIAEQFVQLDFLADQTSQIAATTRDQSVQAELLRAYYALTRRLDTWSLVERIDNSNRNLPHARLKGSERMRDALQQFAQATVDSPRGEGWREYLLVEPLAQELSAGSQLADDQRRKLAQEIMVRISTGRLTSAQQHFVSSEPVAAFSSELRAWAAEPIDVERLAANLETYEATRSPLIAREIAEQHRTLAWSADAEHRALAENIEENYRNANVRLAITEELLNRMLPPQTEPQFQPVRDRILGTPVRGNSFTDTSLRIRLIPDPSFVRFGLEAHGNVASNTVANGGVAQLYSRANTHFLARKLVVVTHDGMKHWPAVANADNDSRLTSIRTNYDDLPFVGSYIRSEAKAEYRQKRWLARSEVEIKVADRAKAELDRKTVPFLQDIEAKFRDRISKLNESGIHTKTISLETTADRIVARLRVAGDLQLAAHTPRHRAPSDSLASVQIHESVLTNMSSQLNLDGQRLTAVELRDLMREKFPKLKSETAQKVPESTIFHFDYEDALTIQINDGQLELTLSFVELIQDQKATRQFKVHAFYRPQIDGMNVTLVRDGALGIEGRLRATDRARLHAVFNKVLDEDRRIPLLDANRMDARGMNGLIVTQTVLEDGWLGLAIGPGTPGRTAQMQRSLR